MKSSLFLTFALVASTVYFNGLESNKSINNRVPASERSPQTVQTCNYKSADIGTVVGSGTDIHKARSVASKVCFERRIDLFENTKNSFPSTEQGQLIIDSCVNIRCS